MRLISFHKKKKKRLFLDSRVSFDPLEKLLVILVIPPACLRRGNEKRRRRKSSEWKKEKNDVGPFSLYQKSYSSR